MAWRGVPVELTIKPRGCSISIKTNDTCGQFQRPALTRPANQFRRPMHQRKLAAPDTCSVRTVQFKVAALGFRRHIKLFSRPDHHQAHEAIMAYLLPFNRRYSGLSRSTMTRSQRSISPPKGGIDDAHPDCAVRHESRATAVSVSVRLEVGSSMMMTRPASKAPSRFRPFADGSRRAVCGLDIRPPPEKARCRMDSLRSIK
jgi:hypothetical protein